MVLIWFFLQGIGVFVESSLSESKNSVGLLEAKNDWWLPAASPHSEGVYKRSKRLINSKQGELFLPTNAVKVVDVPPHSAQLGKKKGSKNGKKKNLDGNMKEDGSPRQMFAGSNKKSKKQGKLKKNNPTYLRQGQSPKRLRQHMQHKIKVKQFLQKRIKEQIEQRSVNPPQRS